MSIMIATALLAGPATAGAVDRDAVCALGLAETAVYARERPGVSAEFRTSLSEGADFFSGVLIGRYEDPELGNVFAAAAAVLVADRKRQELVMECFDRRDKARGRLRAAAEAARKKMPASGKNSKQPR